MKSYVISWLILYGRHVITMVLAGATFFKIVLLLSVIMSNERYMKHTTYRGVKPKSPRSINHTAININCCQDGALQINTHLTTSVSFVVIAECICKGPLNLRKKKHLRSEQREKFWNWFAENIRFYSCVTLTLLLQMVCWHVDKMAWVTMLMIIKDSNSLRKKRRSWVHKG